MEVTTNKETFKRFNSLFNEILEENREKNEEEFAKHFIETMHTALSAMIYLTVQYAPSKLAMLEMIAQAQLLVCKICEEDEEV